MRMLAKKIRSLHDHILTKGHVDKSNCPETGWFGGKMGEAAEFVTSWFTVQFFVVSSTILRQHKF